MTAGTPKTILIIDDDLPIRYTLKKLLFRYLGEAIKIFSSGDGVDGLGLAYVTSPDLIIIDTTLPRYGGREMLDYLSSNPRFTNIPVIVLSEQETDQALPGNYYQLSKRDKNFPLSLLQEVTTKLQLHTIVSMDTFVSKLVNFFANRAVKRANISSIRFRRSEGANIVVKLVRLVIFLIGQLLVSLSIVILQFLAGRGESEENIQQARQDLLAFRVRHYPAVALLIAAAIIIVIQILAVVGGVVSVTFLANRPVSAAAYTWDGGGTDGTCGGAAGDGNKWSCAANWSSDIMPTAADTITFDGTSTKDATVDAGFGGVLTSLTISSGYTGTITMARSLQTTGAFSQAAGTFTAASQTLDIDTTFTLSAGIFTASSVTTSIGGAVSISGSPTFNANGGTVRFDTTGGVSLTCNNVTFNLVSFTHTSGAKTVGATCSLPLGANPSISNAVTLSGTLSGTGTLSQAAGTILLSSGAVLSGFTGINVAAAGNITIAGATADFSAYSTFVGGTLSVTSGTLSLPSGTDLNNGMIFSGGTVNAPAGTMTLDGSLTISGSAVFNANGGTFTFDGSATVALSCNNVTFNLVTFNNSSGTKTVNSNCSLPLGNNPTQTGAGNISVNGTLSGTGTLTNTSGTLIFNAGGALSGFSGISALHFSVLGATINLSGYSSFVAAGIVSLTSGSLTMPASGADLNGTNATGALAISGGTFTAPSGTMTLVGGLNISGSPTFNANGGTITFDGAVAATLSCNNVTFNLVTFAHSGGFVKTVNSNCSLPLGNNPVLATADSASGVTNNGTLSGTGTLTTGVFTFTSGSSLSGFTGLIAGIGGGANFTISGGTADFSTYSVVDFNGTNATTGFNLTGGTFTAPAGTMTVAGGFTISGSAVFNANGGTVSFDSSTGTLSCNSATFNLVSFAGSVSGTKTINSNCTLPLGNNPNGGLSNLTLNGTLSGTGTLTKAGGTVTLNSGAVLSGFSGLSGTSITVAGATANLGSYTTLVATTTFTLSSGSVTLPTGADLNALIISGGTFNAPAGTITVAAALTISGSPTFNAGGGTITFDGGGATLTCNNVTFSNVTFNHASGTKTVNSDCNLPIGANPVLSALASSSVTLNGTLTGTGTISEPDGGLTLNSGAVLSGFSGLTGTSFVVAGATANFGSYATFVSTNTLTVSSGALTLPSGADLNAVVISNGTFNAPSGSMSIAANLTISGSPTFNANGGTVIFDGGGATLSCNNVTFSKVEFNHTGGTKTVSSNCTMPLGANPILPTGANLTDPTAGPTGDITVDGTLTGSGTFTKVGTITFRTGSVFSGFSSINHIFNTFVINGANIDLSAMSSANFGAFSLALGTFTAPAVMNVTGSWFHSAGTFNHNNGTVIIAGNKNINDSTTFYNLTIANVSSGSTTFVAGTTQTILGTLTIKGNSSYFIPLVSSIPGTQWNIDPQGPVDIEYLSVKDSNNISANFIQTFGKHVVNNGNNVKWNFNYPVVSNITVAPSFGGTWTRSTTPSISFTIADPDVSNTVKYRIQIDNNADFSSPEVDTTSSFAPQGTFTFASPVLAQGNYVLRIKGTDNTNGEADYVNSTVKLDLTKPTGLININENALTTASREVSLTLFGEDQQSGIFGIMVSEDPTFAGATIEALVGHKAFTLSPNSGVKTVYVKFVDVAQNISQVYSDTIEYQVPIDSSVVTVPPTTGSDETPPAPTGEEPNVDFKVKVVDAQNNPLSNVTVTLYELGITVQTDSQGFVQFSDIPQGAQLVLGVYDGREFEQQIIVAAEVEEYHIVLEVQPPANNIWIYLLVGLIAVVVIFEIINYLRPRMINRTPAVDGQ